MPFPVEVALIHKAERQLGLKLPMDLRVRCIVTTAARSGPLAT